MTANDIDSLLLRFPELHSCQVDIDMALKTMILVLESDGHIYICGNGGSAADAEHMTTELVKSFVMPRPLDEDFQVRLCEDFHETGRYLATHLENGLRVSSLTSNAAFITAMSNDVGADLIFAQQILALGKKGDLLICISTSGNSANVCHAARVAKTIGMKTGALTGRKGGTIATICDWSIKVPVTETYRIQELHLPVYHFLSAAMENHFFANN